MKMKRTMLANSKNQIFTSQLLYKIIMKTYKKTVELFQVYFQSIKVYLNKIIKVKVKVFLP